MGMNTGRCRQKLVDTAVAAAARKCSGPASELAVDVQRLDKYGVIWFSA